MTSLLLVWTLWATLETVSVPAVGDPYITSNVVERFETHQECDRAATWAESQPDLREDWQVTKSGRKYRTVATYSCRQGR